MGPLHSVSVMTSDDSPSLILRRLDEIERKLHRIMEDLRAPTAIGYSIRRGNRPKTGTDGPKKQIFGVIKQIPGRGQSDWARACKRPEIAAAHA